MAVREAYPSSSSFSESSVGIDMLRMTFVRVSLTMLVIDFDEGRLRRLGDGMAIGRDERFGIFGALGNEGVFTFTLNGIV
jgi:hypothetical protein